VEPQVTRLLVVLGVVFAVSVCAMDTSQEAFIVADVGSDVVELGEALSAKQAHCDKSMRARDQVCRLYGQDSNGCKTVSDALASKLSTWGCEDEDQKVVMGESFGTNTQNYAKSLQNCNDFNKDQIPQSMCRQAKTLCNVENKNYCTAKLQYDCLATIGKACPNSPDMTHASPTPAPVARMMAAPTQVASTNTSSSGSGSGSGSGTGSGSGSRAALE